jgi:hypothetical protein
VSEPKKQLRVFIMAWGWGVDSLRDIALPSLMQRDNIPWLVNNGFTVTISCYTKTPDLTRVRDVFAEMLNGMSFPAYTLNVFVGEADVPNDSPTSFGMKRLAFLTECRYAIEQDSPVFFAAADAFYGNGSLRNICVYNRHPGMALGAPYSRVKRGEFMRMLGEYRAAFPGEPLPNAKLVDIALRCEISGFADSNTDMDKNASFLSSGSFRKLTDDLHVAIFHLPSPVMFWPRKSDFKFFDVWCGGVFTTLDHLWPAKLMAEDRWRTMASSDLFYLVELCDEKVEGEHEYVLEEGRLHNEEFEMVLPNTLAAEQIVFTLRRKPYLS